MLLEAAEETEAIACQAAATSSVVVGRGGGRAGWEIGDGAGGLKGQEGGLEGRCQLDDVLIDWKMYIEG